MDINLIAKIKRGKNRKAVFLSIEQASMPSELVKKIYGKNSNTYFNLVSRALNELVKLKVVKILNPNEKTGRLYILTNRGKEVLKNI